MSKINLCYFIFTIISQLTYKNYFKLISIKKYTSNYILKNFKQIYYILILVTI